MTIRSGHEPTPSAAVPARRIRGEIQALRAVAVLLVVIYHLWPKQVTGGYVGVDVFFVISGFLITAHLMSEVGRTGTVSLRRFWARRIRRLLPAASIVLIASAIAMFAVVPPSLWARTSREIAAAALSFQNWALATNAIDYLGAEGTPTLVQHFWSLSVEEQFYLAWPLLIVGVLLAAKRWAPGGLDRRRLLLAVLAVVFVLSLVFAIIETKANPSIAYFNTANRAWEFAAGGLLSFVPAAAVTALGARLRSVLCASAAVAGWAMILVTGFVYTDATPFPGLSALLPVVGTVLVIASGTPSTGWSLERLYGFWPLRQVGDLSYAIYLWHWPLIVAVPYITLAPLTDLQKVGILIAAIGLAVLSRRFVEQPAQGSRRLSAAPWRSYLFAGVTAFVIVSITTAGAISVFPRQPAPVSEAVLAEPCFGASALVNADSCPRPFAVPAKLDTVAVMNDRGSLGLPCDSPELEVVRCEFGDVVDPVHTIAVIGNSHAGHLVGALGEYGKTHRWKIVLMRHVGCSGALSEVIVPGMSEDCAAWTTNLRAIIMADPSIDTVVFGTNRDSLRYFTKTPIDDSDVQKLREAVSASLAGYVAAGKSVMVFGDVPGNFDQPATECVFLHRRDYDPCTTPREQKESPNEINFVADAARASFGRVGYHDLTDYFCDAERCHVVIGGEVVYIDEHHLSDTFSRSLAPYLGKALEDHLRAMPPRAPAVP